MPVFKNLDGTTCEEFSMGKGSSKVSFRSNFGIIEYKNNTDGEDQWLPISPYQVFLASNTASSDILTHDGTTTFVAGQHLSIGTRETFIFGDFTILSVNSSTQITIDVVLPNAGTDIPWTLRQNIDNHLDGTSIPSIINHLLKLSSGISVNKFTDDVTLSGGAAEVPNVPAVKTYVDDAVAGGATYIGGYNASTNTPDLEAGTDILKGYMYTVTLAGTFFTEAVSAGDFMIAEVDTPTTLSDWTIVEKNIINSDSIANASSISGATTVSDALDALDGAVSDNTTHRGLTNNPHGVSASQIGDIAPSQIIGFASEVERVTDVVANSTHRALTSGNPHNVSASDVGLGNVNNTSDADKPVSDATQSALNTKQKTLTTASIAIAVGDWSANEAVKTVSGVTSSNIVFVSPTPASVDDYADAGIRATGQDTDELTFECTETPTSTVNVNIIIGD